MNRIEETEAAGSRPNAVTWRWLAGVLITLLVLAVGAWARDLSNRVNMLEGTKASVADITDIKERLKTIEGDVKELLRRP